MTGSNEDFAVTEERTLSLLGDKPVIKYNEQYGEYVAYWYGYAMPISMLASFIGNLFFNIVLANDTKSAIMEDYFQLHSIGLFDGEHTQLNAANISRNSDSSYLFNMIQSKESYNTEYNYFAKYFFQKVIPNTVLLQNKYTPQEALKWLDVRSNND